MPGDASVRRSIQDLVLSIDRNVKIDPEVEDLLLDIADEFIDSVTNFGCRLAKRRGGKILEVRDLQPHLERNHNIRIPGFASDLTPIALFADGCSARASRYTGYEEGRARRAKFASCPPSGTGGTGQARGEAYVDAHYNLACN